MDKATIPVPPHKGSMILTVDGHKAVYESVEDYLKGFGEEHTSFSSDEEKRLAIETDTIWELQWYPDTPVGFYCIGAASPEALMAAYEDFILEDQ